MPRSLGIYLFLVIQLALATTSDRNTGGYCGVRKETMVFTHDVLIEELYREQLKKGYSHWRQSHVEERAGFVMKRRLIISYRVGLLCQGRNCRVVELEKAEHSTHCDHLLPSSNPPSRIHKAKPRPEHPPQIIRWRVNARPDVHEEQM